MVGTVVVSTVNHSDWRSEVVSCMFSTLYEKSKFWVLGGVWSHQEWRLWRYVTQHGKNSPGPDTVLLFHDWCTAIVCWWSDWSGQLRQRRRPLLAEQCQVCVFSEYLFQGRPVSNARKSQATTGLWFLKKKSNITSMITLSLACP